MRSPTMPTRPEPVTRPEPAVGQVWRDKWGNEFLIVSLYEHGMTADRFDLLFSFEAIYQDTRSVDETDTYLAHSAASRFREVKSD